MFVLDNDIYCTVGYISSIILRYVEQLEVAGKPQLYGYDLKLITTLCVTGTCLFSRILSTTLKKIQIFILPE